MSRKPTIKISYPDASDVAMKLTEAMVRRAPGRRVVETTSEDSASPAGGELFADFDACSTSTSVDLTLTLNSASMDYALETLIRPNLTADERKRILGEDAEQTELALTPGEQKKIDASAEQLADELIIEPEKKIDVGKIADADLRIILADLVDAAQGYVQGGQDAWEKHIENAIETAIKEIDHRAGVIDLDETYNEERDYSYKTYALIGLILTKIEMLKATKNPSPQNTLVLLGLDLKDHLKRFEHDPEGAFLDAYQVAYPRRNVYPATPTEEEIMVDDLTKFLYKHDPVRSAGDYPSWDDVEAEARSMGKKQDQDIEPGLLNDLDDGSDGMAPAEEVMGHDE